MRITSLVVLVIVLFAIIAVASVALAWRLADRILVPAPYALMPEFEIVDVRHAAGDPSRMQVLLPPQPADGSQFSRTDASGRFGLLWDGGGGRLGPVAGREAGAVVRSLALTHGRPPRPGDAARMDFVLFHEGPSARGLDHVDVEVPGPLGPLPAWWSAGHPHDAILVIHGRRRADRTEALRILPSLRAGGASVLVSSYRNHDASPPSPDGFYHYGATEVQDALAAVNWLRARGVRRVVLVGFSMGGAIALQAWDAWPDDAPELAGVILDSPLIDPPTVFRRVARRTPLPGAGPLSRLTTAVAGFRAGIDWSRLDGRRIAPRLELPLLLIGGTADDTVPIELLDAFAAALPGEAHYLRLDDVQHVEGWNAAPRRYERAVTAFLARLGIGAE